MSDLPHDILAKIFIYLINYYGSPTNLLNARSVCRQWRIAFYQNIHLFHIDLQYNLWYYGMPSNTMTESLYGIKSISLDCRNLKGDIFSSLSRSKEINISNFKHLNINQTLNLLTNVQKLNLTFSNVTDEHIKLLSKLKHLRVLILIHCSKITDECMKYLGNIEDLHPSWTITNQGIINLPSNSLLRKLKTSISMDNNVIKYLPRLKKLTELNCSDMCIENEDMKYFSEMNISKLYINCSKLTSDSEFRHLSGIPYINMTASSSIGNECIYWLRNVSKIRIHGASSITDESLHYMTNCISINLCFIENITNEGIRFLINNNKKLNSLKLNWCKLLTKVVIEDLDNVKHISHISIRNGLEFLYRK